MGTPFECSPARPALRGWLTRLRLDARKRPHHTWYGAGATISGYSSYSHGLVRATKAFTAYKTLMAAWGIAVLVAPFAFPVQRHCSDISSVEPINSFAMRSNSDVETVFSLLCLTISKLLGGWSIAADGVHTASFAAFTPEDASSRGSPKGIQANPVFMGRCSQKASDASAMRYADVTPCCAQQLGRL